MTGRLMKMMTFAHSGTLTRLPLKQPNPVRSVDPFAETALLDPVEPIELDKRLPFPEHAYGMYSLRRMWDKFWKGS
jgi:hypothetical protein